VRFVAILFAACLWAAPAATEPLPWEGTSIYDPESGYECCDHQDCGPIPATDVKEQKTGYVYLPTGEVIPWSRVIWKGLDGGFWRCRFMWPKETNRTRCFVAPPQGF
jgi:hypothetical protein